MTTKKHTLEVMSDLIDIADNFAKTWAGRELWIEYKHSLLPEDRHFSICITDDQCNISENSFLNLYPHKIKESDSDTTFQPTRDGFRALTERLDNLAMSNQP